MNNVRKVVVTLYLRGIAAYIVLFFPGEQRRSLKLFDETLDGIYALGAADALLGKAPSQR